MALTLTKVAIATRKTVRYGIYIIIFIIVGKITFDKSYTIFRHFFPKPPPPPTVEFNKLPKLPFPQREKVNLSYTLETPESGLPQLATQAKVYLMTKLSSDLLSLDAAKQTVGSLGFDVNTPHQLSETVYRFQNREATSSLEINIVTGSFSLSYDFAKDPTPLQKRPPLPAIAEQSVRGFLEGSSLLPKDMVDGPATYDFLKTQDGKFVTSLSVSDSNLVKIKLYRGEYDKLPSLTPDPSEANVWFLVSGSSGSKSAVIPVGEYHYFPIDESKFATYGLKSSAVAWDELTKGNAYIANVGQNKDGDSVKIRRVYLGYYDPGVSTEFYQPIFVFEGDKGFTAYVPAVTPDYYGDST